MFKPLIPALVLVLLAGISATAQADDEFVMKCATVAPEGTPWEKQLKRFKKHVEKASGGRIKI
ncbi:MAG: hypothetical protein KC416_06105, partial [Myxococcales bacterium]|nr:hypothetical protein [Myxococcales bacterium]